MSTAGRAALTLAMERSWQTLVSVRDELKDQGLGMAAARLSRLCTELDDLRAVLVQRAPAAGELSEALAGELAKRATLYAEQAVERVDLETPDPMMPITEAIASGFVVGYGACLDDSRPAKSVFRDRGRSKGARK